MRIFFLLCILCTYGCASDVPPFEGGFTNGAADIVTQFERDWGHKVTTPIYEVSSAEFERDEQEQGAVAFCSAIENIEGVETRRITIDSDYWENTNPLGRFIVLYHELGHCELHRDHRNELDPNNCPYSMMFWNIDPTYECIINGTKSIIEYKKELFSGQDG